jgi:hypothetical protein
MLDFVGEKKNRLLLSTPDNSYLEDLHNDQQNFLFFESTIVFFFVEKIDQKNNCRFWEIMASANMSIWRDFCPKFSARGTYSPHVHWFSRKLCKKNLRNFIEENIK